MEAVSLEKGLYSAAEIEILLVNGPPRSGKDTVANYLAAHYGFRHVKFAGALKRATHALVQELNGSNEPLLSDAFEWAKDEPNTAFFGSTPRETYIAVSEWLCKELWGDRIFGTVLAKQIARLALRGEKRFVVSDSGFVEEARELVEWFGHDRIKLIRMHRDGCDFSKDSRGHVSLPDVEELDLHNNGAVDDLHDALDIIYERNYGRQEED